MSLRVPFMSLVPGDDATAVREAIDRVIAKTPGSVIEHPPALKILLLTEIVLD